MQQHNKPVDRPPHARLQTLTPERARALLDYDASTGVLRWRVNRRGKARAGTIAGRLLDHGHVQLSIDGRRYYAHRVIFLMMTGRSPENEIDHRNGVGHDNRWINLREATRAENGRNRRIQRNNKSGFNGVYFQKATRRWVASICVAGKTISLGSQAVPELAAGAYARAANIHHGEFARAA